MSPVNNGVDDKTFSEIINSMNGTPYYQYMGIEIQLMKPGYMELKTVATQQHTNSIDFVHGGFIISLADAAMGNSIRTLGIQGVTVDCSTSLLSSAPLGAEIVSKGTVTKAGKNLIFAQAKVYADGNLIAESKATFFRIGSFKHKQ